MSHTQLQKGILGETTTALRSIASLDLQRRQLEERQQQNFFQNIISLAKEDPENATRILNESPFGKKFGEVKFMGSRGDFSSFSFFDPESGQRQSAILNRSTGEFEPVGGAQAKTGDDDLDALLAQILKEGEGDGEPEPVIPPVLPAPGPGPTPSPEPTPVPSGREGLFPDVGDVGIGRAGEAVKKPRRRKPIPAGHVAIEITIGEDQGRTGTVPVKDFDPRSMRRIE